MDSTSHNAKQARANRDELVIHVNAFTSRIDGGYLAQDGTKIGRTMTALQIAAYLTNNIKTRVKFMSV